jgi:hypothetical protein
VLLKVLPESSTSLQPIILLQDQAIKKNMAEDVAMVHHPTDSHIGSLFVAGEFF